MSLPHGKSILIRGIGELSLMTKGYADLYYNEPVQYTKSKSSPMRVMGGRPAMKVSRSESTIRIT